MKAYEIDDEIDFGFYEGIQMRFIHMCDPQYLEWCLMNVDDFCLVQFNLLFDVAIRVKKKPWKAKAMGIREANRCTEHLRPLNRTELNELFEKHRLTGSKFVYSDLAIEKNTKNLSQLGL